MREIITLQLGNTSNFLGAHYWNLQHEAGIRYGRAAELDPDVLFHSGEVAGTLTYTPRALFFDLEGSFGSLLLDGFLYSQASHTSACEDTDLAWTGTVTKHVADPIPRHPILHAWERAETEADVSDAPPLETVVQDLDETVRYWSDYQKVHLHPKSMYRIKFFGEEESVFDRHCYGHAVFARQEEAENIRERLRWWAEACDSLQGFQCVVDAATGFGGLAADVLTVIRDEFPRVGVVTFGHSSVHDNSRVSFFTEAYSLAELSEHTSVYVPMSSRTWSSQTFPHMPYLSTTTRYRHTAVPACAIDVATSACRLSSQPIDLVDLSNFVSPRRSLPLAFPSLALPFPLTSKTTCHDFFSAAQPFSSSGFTIPLLAEIQSKTRGPFAEMVSLRGVPTIPLAPGQRSTDEALLLYLARSERFACRSAVIDQPLAVSETFPDLFASHVMDDGCLRTKPSENDEAPSPTRVHSLPAFLHLECSARITPLLCRMTEEFHKIGRADYKRENISQDEVAELEERLHVLTDDYSEE